MEQLHITKLRGKTGSIESTTSITFNALEEQWQRAVRSSAALYNPHKPLKEGEIAQSTTPVYITLENDGEHQVVFNGGYSSPLPEIVQNLVKTVEEQESISTIAALEIHQ